MRNYLIRQILLSIMLGFFTITGFAWDRSLELGYGISHDPNDTKHNNSGLLLSGDIWPIWRNCLSYWSLNGALGHWYSTAQNNKHLSTAALAVALRLYPLTNESAYPVYLLASGGPAYLSTKQFGANQQGSNWAFQTFGGVGVEHGHFDTNLRFVHYSNAGLSHPNQGYNILYLLSFGYLF